MRDVKRGQLNVACGDSSFVLLPLLFSFIVRVFTVFNCLGKRIPGSVVKESASPFTGLGWVMLPLTDSCPP